ncbi:MAG: hypothetical protein BZY88_04320 [SAR202 cluster bacterium Io17-Chloro-G9]|nr:MAG: hypothetical protein BZY88_04320 [SAR202 cluster bacterium Io17-Chloro-G9]
MSFTGRIAGWSARHRWWVIAASILVIFLAIFTANTVETKLLDYDGEGESAYGADLIGERFDLDFAPTEQLIFSNSTLDANTPAYRAEVEDLVRQLRALPEVASVTSFYDTGDPTMVSDDGHVVLAQVVIAGDESDAEDKIDAILNTVRAAGANNAGSFEIAIAGNTSIIQQLEKIDEEDFATMMIVTMVLALTFMLIAFRGVVAALIPLVMALGSIFTALGVATIVSHVYPMVDFLAQVVLLMGMAVGVDYSLFIVSRYRSERKAGRAKLEAITLASNTTGRAVFYAGIVVLLSLAGLILTGSAIFVSMSIGVIIVVFLALAASLTLLPALLAALGDNVNRLRLPFIGREGNDNGGVWGAITDKVLARPVVMASITALALAAIAVPAFSLNLAFASGSDSLHDAVEAKRGLELLEENFTSGLADPAYVIVDASNVNAPEVQAQVARLIAMAGDDKAFFPPFETRINAAGSLLYVQIPMAGGTNEDEAESNVRHLRQDIVPVAFSDTNTRVYVSGSAAGSIDFTDQMVGTAPYVFGFVLGLSFLLLLVMFRSIVIPVKAIGLNLLSVGAAYGVLVMVFQWGWGITLLGSDATGVIMPWLPLFLFAILFGLSMDYHMLLLNRIKEGYDQGLTNEESVSQGIRMTAGQITSAAAIMVGIFGTFALGRSVELQQMGVGLGVAILIDATVIRSVLLPASMKLLGDRNWYLPTWLEWLPNVSTERATPALPVMAFTATAPAPASGGD